MSPRATINTHHLPTNTLLTPSKLPFQPSTRPATVKPASTSDISERSSYHNTPYHASSLAPTTYTLNLVGTLGLALVIGVIIYDFIAYIFAVYRNSTNNYSPYGRRIATLASDLWDKKSFVSGLSPYFQGRSLEPMTEVLDAIADAAHKWGGPTDTEQPDQQHYQQQQQQQNQQKQLIPKLPHQSQQNQQQWRTQPERKTSGTGDIVFKD